MARLQLIDIGVNLTDKMFRGIYRGKVHHKDDFQHVLSRAFSVGLEKIIVTAGSLSEGIEAVTIVGSDERLFCTIGCHPTRCAEFACDPDNYSNELQNLIQSNRDKVVAVGECGLDYERENFCARDIQQKYFREQLKIASRVNLPLFFHCRAAHQDFINILEVANKDYFHNGSARGVVHTFDGSLEHANVLIELGFHIGLNGCSLKTNENLEVVKSLPVTRILLETDAPWCEIRPTHSGYVYVKTHHKAFKSTKWEEGCMVKGRNEPANILQVLEVVAALHGMSEDELAAVVHENTLRLFFPNELDNKLD